MRKPSRPGWLETSECQWRRAIPQAGVEKVQRRSRPPGETRRAWGSASRCMVRAATQEEQRDEGRRVELPPEGAAPASVRGIAETEGRLGWRQELHGPDRLRPDPVQGRDPRRGWTLVRPFRPLLVRRDQDRPEQGGDPEEGQPHPEALHEARGEASDEVLDADLRQRPFPPRRTEAGGASSAARGRCRASGRAERGTVSRGNGSPRPATSSAANRLRRRRG